jgi:hypothetical protein
MGGDLMIALAAIAVWVLLQWVVLPRLGVPT